MPKIIPTYDNFGRTVELMFGNNWHCDRGCGRREVSLTVPPLLPAGWQGHGPSITHNSATICTLPHKYLLLLMLPCTTFCLVSLCLLFSSSWNAWVVSQLLGTIDHLIRVRIGDHTLWPSHVISWTLHRSNHTSSPPIMCILQRLLWWSYGRKWV